MRTGAGYEKSAAFYYLHCRNIDVAVASVGVGNLVRAFAECGRVENYGIESGIDVRYFSEGTIHKIGGNILLGSDNGIYIFSPEKLKKQDYFSPLVFSRLLLFGKEVYYKNSPMIVTPLAPNALDTISQTIHIKI